MRRVTGGPRPSRSVASMVVAALVATVCGVAVEAAQAAPLPVNFAPKTAFGTGGNPLSVAMSDLDGDSSLDLVTANLGSDDVSVLLGDGAGSFGGLTDFAAGTEPSSISVSDVDGDTFGDLVVANYTSDSVSVLLGDGTGGFGAKTDFGTGDSPISVVVADLDGDTADDIVTSNYVSNNVSVLLGDGSGGFGAKTDFATGNGPELLAVADLNGDTVVDLAVPSQLSSNVAVLLGDGAGGFGAKTDFETGVDPRSVGADDLNGDTFVDLAVANQGANTVSVLLGDGTGSFGAKTDFATGGGGPYSVAVGDLNGDAFDDLATANYGSGTASVLLGDGTGAFGANIDFDIGNGASSVAIGDLNGDSRLDLAVAVYVSDTVAVLLNSTGDPVTVPGAPTIGTATAGNGQATVSWAAPASHGGAAITGYVVTPYIGATAQTPVPVGPLPTSYTITGLTNGTTYTFTVAATNSEGTGAESDASNAVTPTPTVPGAPTILRNATAGHESATVSWTAPASDGGSAVTGYVVTPYVGYFPLPPVTFASTVTTQTVTGLTDGTTYRFRVRALNTVGAGGYSTISNAVTPTPLPGPPTIGSATAGNGQATVSWTAPASEGATPITSYVVTPYIGYFPLSPVTFSSTATTQIVTGLTNGTTYRFRVRATNASGTGQYSTVTNPVTPTA